MRIRLSQHRRLLLRTYLILLAGVVLIAVLLELGLNYLEQPSADESDPWVSATLAIIEDRLINAESAEDTLARLEETIGIPLALLEHTDIASSIEDSQGTRRLTDESGRTAYLHISDTLPQAIYLGPLESEPDKTLYRWAPTVYYLLVFGLIGVWLRPLLRDIDTISTAATHFSQDYRHPTQSALKTSELTTLATQVDTMSARLSGLIQSQKELIAALSHEMRTPLARLRFAVAMRHEQNDANAYPSISSIQQDLDEIESLTNAMLEFARLDHPELALNRQNVSAGTLLAAIDTRPLKENVELVIAIDAALSINVDVRLMALAISNLLTNAQRYASSRVTLKLENTSAGSSLSIEDDGIGIPESDRETVFKAFTRLDESRARHTGGFGLGLAIVARIAALHGGVAKVDASEALGGARFTVQWPAST